MIDKKVDYVEEKPLPGDQVERIYHGKAVYSEECRTALDQESREALAELAPQLSWKARLKNGAMVKRTETDIEKLEAQGMLAATHHRFAGYSFGDRPSPRCSVCGRERDRLRSIEGGPLFCLKGDCEDRVREQRERDGNLADHAR